MVVEGLRGRTHLGLEVMQYSQQYKEVGQEKCIALMERFTERSTEKL
jgi:hypothetical protein